MEKLAERARATRTPDEFTALAAELSDGDLKLKPESIYTDRTTMTVPAFAEAAFALAPGATSGVVETRFGYHVIYLVRRIPEEHRTLDDARADLTDEIWPAVRRREFARFVDGLVDRHQVALHPELERFLASDSEPHAGGTVLDEPAGEGAP
jgi:peptidyl-prolyl cis-trans isomerase C